ncbi:hypothetical protein XELAEV_18040173mg [Xenopus laevis]|uniref:G-protein coupled receptors family 1 profile domain-containing protein n=1 Tax=Xenopus laevis TaxID=8355 RepID=A0A974H8J6_XENLA|nr:hypothetical protein XELAEV_18040173mg [Xenopus laevis]
MVTELFLLGFNSHTNLKILLFTIFLLIYISLLIGNVLIIILVSTSPNLKNPMYSFLKHLALADILFTTNIIPNMLYVMLNDGGNITTAGCFTQYFFHSFSIIAQSLILTSMAFDRYLAICYPLRYLSIMNSKVCSLLIFWSWATSFILLPSEFTLMSQLKFCGSNVIDHFFCDLAPVLAIASTDIYRVQLEDFVLAVLVIIVPFVIVIISYICIFEAILNISTTSGKKKAFSTCSTHLVTICTYYGTMITIYAFPFWQDTPNEGKFKSLLYTVFTPFLNPILYSMRNKEIQNSLYKLFCKTT